MQSDSCIPRLSGLLCFVFATGCGTVITAEDTQRVPATSLYVNGNGCAETRSADTAIEALTPADAGEGIAVVEIFEQNECSGLGGHYLLAREVDSYRAFWLGGHDCLFLPEPLRAGSQFGVIRYGITAALFQLPSDLCIGFPDESPGAETNLTTKTIAVFPTLADARSTAAVLGE